MDLLSLTGQPGPVERCHLRCADLTVLVGANDAGKTFVLDGIDAALRDDEAWHYSASLEVFFRADRTEIETSDATYQVQHDHPGELRLFGSHELPPDDIAAELVDELVRSGSNEDGHLAVIVTPSEGLERPIWLCAAPWSTLDEKLRAALRTTWPEGAAIAEERPWRPLPVECVAEAGIAAVLEPIRVPAPPGIVEAGVGAAVVALTRALRQLPARIDHDVAPGEIWGPLVGLPVEPLPPPPADEPPESTLVLLREDEASTSVCETALFVCMVLESLINEVLPSFVATRYRVRLIPRSVTQIARGASVAVTLEDRRSGVQFPLERTAARYGLWLQFALREASARLDWYAHIIDHGGQRLEELGAFVADDEWLALQQAEELTSALATMLGLLTQPRAPHARRG